MKGAHVLTHRKTPVDRPAWEQAQPKLYQGPPKPSAAGAAGLRGQRLAPDAKTGLAAGALEAESLQARPSAGRTVVQSMTAFKSDRWSGDAQLFWTGAKPGDTLELELPAPPATEKADTAKPGTVKPGTVDFDIVFTCARDYGIVQLSLDGKPLGKPIDLYDPQVITSGLLTFPKQELKPGTHTLTLQIVGVNPQAAKSYMVGIDYVRVRGNGE